MAKYHINDNGEPGACKAAGGNCPFGGDERHYNSKEEAQQAFEQEMSARMFTAFTKLPPNEKKNLVFLVDGLAKSREENPGEDFQVTLTPRVNEPTRGQKIVALEGRLTKISSPLADWSHKENAAEVNSIWAEAKKLKDRKLQARIANDFSKKLRYGLGVNTLSGRYGDIVDHLNRDQVAQLIAGWRSTKQKEFAQVFPKHAATVEQLPAILARKRKELEEKLEAERQQSRSITSAASYGSKRSHK